MIDHLEKQLNIGVEAWKRRGWPTPDVMVVAGSGLSTDLGRRVEGPHFWTDLLPFPIEGIEGHPLVFELLQPIPGRVVLSSRGRLHAYQGYTLPQVVFTIRLARMLGAKVLVMTNSSGAVRPEFATGSLVLVNDHLNLTGSNVLYGNFPKTWGPQFPDMSQAYDADIQRLIRESAHELDIELHEGVYAGLSGPTYETPAEVRMVGTLGGDLVGMSTVQEVIAAHHMGMRCACVSAVSNPAAGVSDEVLDHADVLERGRAAGAKLGQLLGQLLVHPQLC